MAPEICSRCWIEMAILLEKKEAEVASGCLAKNDGDPEGKLGGTARLALMGGR